MKMMMNKYELKRILLDWFFPNRCPLCSKVIGRMDYICDKCACEFEYNKKEESLCGGRLLSVCRYNKKTSPVVIGAKKHRDGSKISFMAYTLVQKITGYYETLRMSSYLFLFIIRIKSEKATAIPRRYAVRFPK